MSPAKQGKLSFTTWALIGFFVVAIAVSAYIVMVVLSDDSPKKKSQVTTISLIKPPPPPPPVKEKPPEPEKPMEKKEQIVAPGPQDQPKNADNQDDTPAGKDLGLDADGKAGGDGFGLVGRKGGRSILSGGGGGGLGKVSLLKKFSWYSQIVETQVRKAVLKRLDERGGVPRGSLQTIVQITLNTQGAIEGYKIIGSSGNHRMDDAVKEALAIMKRISEPPPEEMPRVMSIRITSQG